jgi:hypothetical protein
MLAASALQLMVPFLRNHVAKAPGTYQIEPAEIIQLPSVLTYTYVPVTGAIIARQVKKDHEQKKGSSPKKRTSTGSTASETAAKKAKPTPPEAPIPAGEVEQAADDEEGEATDPEDESETKPDEDQEAMDAQLMEVSAIQAKAKGKAKAKGQGKK